MIKFVNVLVVIRKYASYIIFLKSKKINPRDRVLDISVFPLGIKRFHTT